MSNTFIGLPHVTDDNFPAGSPAPAPQIRVSPSDNVRLTNLRIIIIIIKCRTCNFDFSTTGKQFWQNQTVAVVMATKAVSKALSSTPFNVAGA